MRTIRKALPLCLALLLLCGTARAQRFSVSTNVIEWANLGTVNGEVGMAVAQHVSVHAGARYNNWTFRKGNPDDRFADPDGETERQFENRKQAYSLGFRYWPWYVYSGWWGYVRGQYMEYNRGGLFHREAEEGDAYGVGIGVGYTLMIGRSWNIEFGAGGWAGYTNYTTYRCTNCGSVVEQGRKSFVLPDDAFVSFIFVF